MSHPAKKGTQKSTTPALVRLKPHGARESTSASSKTSKGFTDEERAAMKNRAQELKAEARGNKNKADGKSDVTIEELIAEDDKVVTRYMAQITLSAATKGIWIDWIQNNKVVESWVDWDRLGLFRQLGIIPA
jgi:hypothetical protein